MRRLRARDARAQLIGLELVPWTWGSGMRVGRANDAYLYMYSYAVPRPPLPPADVQFGVQLGLSLREQRQHSLLSGMELSRESGVSLDTIRSIESGRVGSPGLLVSCRLSRALGLSVDDLALRALQDWERASTQ